MAEPVPTFRVAFVPGVTPTKWERVWRERMPRQRLELRPASATDALAGLRDGSVDAAFLREVAELGVQPGADWGVIRLYDEASVVVASRDHLFAALDSNEAVGSAELAAENVLPGQDGETVELVAAGVGVAQMPQSLARLLSRRDVVSRPLRDASVTTISLVWPVERTSAAVEAFIGIVRGRTANSSR